MCLGIPGQIVSIHDAEKKLGLVDVGGVKRVTNLACILDGRAPEETLGDWVLVHVGFAMSRIDPEEARRTLALLEELGDVQDELDQMRRAQEELARG
jgi:hydrogenase expression/formation protein HypC